MWEYKVVDDGCGFEDRLNELGKLGFDIVGVLQAGGERRIPSVILRRWVTVI